MNLLLPPTCLGCGFHGVPICQLCLNKIKWQLGRICPVCKKDLVILENCHCGFLDDLWKLSDYDGLISQAIKDFKYQFAVDLLDLIWTKKIETLSYRLSISDPENWIIIPIPLHRRRYLTRGFNQAELIADRLSAITGIKKINDLLIRSVNNKPQAGFSNLLDRRRNSTGIFKVDYRLLSSCFSKKILIIDDVYTTGSTLTSAVSVLRSYGFENISALVLAVSR